jgi:hypothetical protein
MFGEATLCPALRRYGQDVADGYEVDPEALRAASGVFHANADAVTRAAVSLSVAQLTPAALGEVDAAYELAAAFAEFVGRHEDNLRQDALSVSDTATGLATNAEEYTRREEAWPL